MIGKRYFLPLAVISAFLICAKGETEAASSLKIVCYRQSLYFANGASNNENCDFVVLQVGSLDSKYGLVTQPFGLSTLSPYKKKYPHIKLILGIDPFDLRHNGFPKVIKSKVGRSRIISDAVSAMKNNGYDGIDLMFREKYVQETAQVASGIRKVIGGDGFTLSGFFVRNVSRDDFHHADLGDIAEDLDFLTAECYQPSKTKPYTQLVAPLYSKRKDSVSGCIQRYVDMGAPRNKVLMAIQTYAVSHTLDDADEMEPGSPARNAGWQQYPSNKPGFLYLDQVTGPDWESYRDEKTNAPYAVNYLQWASYDDETTVVEKAKFIKEKGLGGAALTTLKGMDRTTKDLPFAKYIAEVFGS